MNKRLEPFSIKVRRCKGRVGVIPVAYPYYTVDMAIDKLKGEGKFS